MKTKQHELKMWPDPFSAVVIDQKRHVIRQDDRGFRVGDMLWLREWDPFSKEYTGRECRCVVLCKTNGGEWGLPPGLCVMTIELWNDRAATAGGEQ
jgi:hypothetical protein